MRVEHGAELLDGVAAVANSRLGDDDFLARGEIGGDAQRLNGPRQIAVARPHRDMPAYPAEHAPMSREGVLGRPVENDHLALCDAELGQICGELTQVAAAIAVQNHDIGAAAIHSFSVSHLGVGDSESNAETEC